MKIGELARITRCTPDTIRFYEKEGLLPPAQRTQSNYRTYGEAHVERLRLIRNCREFDMTHDEVRVLLKALDSQEADCCAINALIDTHIEHVRTRIDELIALRAHLTDLRAKCSGTRDVHACAIMQELSSKETSGPKARKTHLG
jgi:Cd(II)/Pb(II)-responsive transcriptional regulator